MKPTKLPPPKLGMDVRHAEGEIPKGAVRSARNVVLTDEGGFIRSPGSVLRGTLEGAHSMWYAHHLGIAFAAADDTLYEVTLGNPTTFDAVFSGLPLEEPIEYATLGTDVYFTSGGVLGKRCADGLVRRPGVADLIGFAPTLAPTLGNLFPGRYGVAYSLTNDLGEESPLSSIAWLDLPSGGGIMLDGLVTATDVVRLNVYVTAANGRELYENHSISWAPTTSVVDQRLERLAPKKGMVVMPGGQIVRHWHGRLVVAQGGYLIFSDPFDPGVADPAYGWMAVGGRVLMMEPVEGGIWVGTADRTYFYKGAGPDDLAMVSSAPRGAIEHSGQLADQDFFDQQLVGPLPPAVWLSEVGLTLGTADGRLLTPQSDRIHMAFDGLARPVLAQIAGVKQAIFSVESMSTGANGPTDGTV